MKGPKERELGSRGSKSWKVTRKATIDKGCLEKFVIQAHFGLSPLQNEAPLAIR